MTRIGSSTNLPTTDPLWIDQRIMDDKELTPDELKTSKQQTAELTKVIESLSQPVKKGDNKAAKARVDDLQKQFEAMSPDDKKYMYGVLQTDTGLAKEFHYRLSTPSRDKLLKTLNPDHKSDHIQKYTLNDAREKAAKNLEKNMEGASRQKELDEMMKKKEQWIEEKMDNISQ